MDEKRNTEASRRVSPKSFLRAMPSPYGTTSSDKHPDFLVVPADPGRQDRALQSGKTWRMTLTSAQNSTQVIGLELRGDAVFGSSEEPDDTIDVNLAEMEGKSRSVSQNHMRMRPSKNNLFIMDMGSKNGTFVNGSAASRDRAYPLQDGDLLTLGRVHMRLKIVEQP